MIDDTHIPHEDAASKATDAQMRRTSNVGAIPNAVAAVGSAPTKAEYDTVVAKLNLALQVLRDAELIPAA